MWKNIQKVNYEIIFRLRNRTKNTKTAVTRRAKLYNLHISYFGNFKFFYMHIHTHTEVQSKNCVVEEQAEWKGDKGAVPPNLYLTSPGLL